MEIVVLMKQVPDLVEELEIIPSGHAIDRDLTRFVVGEADAHALEEAVLLKERYGGTVTVVTLDIGEVDDLLFAAIARGADRVMKVTGEFPEFLESHHIALAMTKVLKELKHDLVLTSSQAIDDLDGSPGALLSGYLGLPYVSVVNKVELVGSDQAIVSKELSGGAVMELQLQLPAVVGILSAEQPPRYVPISKVRQVMRTTIIDQVATDISFSGTINIREIRKPEPSRRATMFQGESDKVADMILQLLRENGILR